jgi:hypothetical protein
METLLTSGLLSGNPAASSCPILAPFVKPKDSKKKCVAARKLDEVGSILDVFA